jgi:hypothetical protein
MTAVTLKPVQASSFENGVVLLRYGIRKQAD